MIDLHSHLLPGIDDGARSLDESLQLARMAVADGITHITFTPHIHPGRYDNSVNTIEPVFLKLQQALKDEAIPLTVAMSGEVRLSAEVLMLVAQNQVPFLGEWEGKQVMLLELPHSHIPPGSDKLVKWLLDRNILPMIAHPERNKDIMRDLDMIAPFVEMGCLFQITAMSVAGGFGVPAAQRSMEILEKGWATVLATDAHNLDRRPPVLSGGFAAARAVVGEEAASALVFDNPRAIAGL
ncbi:capsular biosynthesis protein [Pontibacterium sp. N1Y112]|uniref:protein-tyrosine-phosphatase n=1 Tax=Pontibacterium sinense TaxID=2781979 RepID=A0A8J7FEW9_9GAMM|nr:CpsB/CapC family capsule biosynthesis tyrosine phosphatase [Pontibacterium sinense]MBE9398394.1 capsular biosynthesis protein [Pontibacterium sinense]